MTENTETHDHDDNMTTALLAALIGKAVQSVTVTIPTDALTGDYLAHLVADWSRRDHRPARGRHAALAGCPLHDRPRRRFRHRGRHGVYVPVLSA